MSIIKKPSAVDSPYVDTTPAAPTRLASSPVAGGGVSTVAANVAQTESVGANANTDTALSSTGSNVSYYTSGIEGIAGLASYGRVFAGANVFVTLEQPQYNTYNQVYTGNGTVGGSNGQVQFNNAGSFGGSANLTFDGANVVVEGIKTDNYLYANGTPFSASADLGNWAFTANTQYNLNGGTINNSDLSHGGTAGITIPPNGNTSVLNLLNYYGNITVTAAASPGTTKTWTFDNTGKLILPQGSRIVEQGEGMVELTAGAGDNSYASLASFNGNSYMWVDNTAAYIGTAYTGNSKTWTFDTTGNLTLPTNTSSINYANGNPYGGGGASTGNVTFDDFVVQGPASYTGLGLSASPDDTANLKYLQVRAGDIDSHIHFDTGNNNAYDQYFGNDNKYLKLEAGVAGNVLIGTYEDGGVGQLTWVFDSHGKLNIPGPITSASDTEITAVDDVDIYGGDKTEGGSEGGDIFITGGTGAPDNGTSTGSGGDVSIAGGEGGYGVDQGTASGGEINIAGGPGGAANDGNSIQAGEGGTVIIQGGQGGDQVGNIALSALGGNVEILGGQGSFDNANSVPSGAPGHVNLYGGNWGWITPSGNIYLNTYTGSSFKTLTYDNTGNLTAPGNIITADNFVGTSLRTNLTDFNWSENITAIATGATTLVTLANNVFGDPYTGQITITGVGGATEANATWWYQAEDSNQFALYTDNTFTTPVDSSAWGAYTSGGVATTLDYGNVEINALNTIIRSDHGDYNNHIWRFDQIGQTIFPYMDVARGDNPSGNITGYVLNMGDGTNEAIITTPDGNATSQRLVINPGKGADGTTGEGGDIYLWAGRGGDAGGTGGDIKIRGGQGMVDGAGGYIRIEGGDSQTSGEGGYIVIQAGGTSGPNAGYTHIFGGSNGNGNGGDANIAGGYGTGTGGTVNITGGVSGQGLGDYGNVNITAGASGWTFDNTGNLTIPGVVTSVNNIDLFAGDAVTITSNNTGNINTWQFDETGNLTVPGNIIGSQANVDLVAGVYTWTFDETGILTVPSEGVIRSINDTVILQSKNSGTGNLYSARLGTNGGLYFEGTEYPSGWLSLENNSGNANITAASGTGGAGGKNLYITAGAADQSDYYTTAGGAVNITGGLGASNDGGGGGPGGNINIDAGASADPAGHAGNINITAGTGTMVFDYTGNLTVSGNIVSNVAGYAIGYRDIPQVAFSANASAALTDAGKHYYSTTAGNLALTLPDNSSVAFPTGATLTIVVNAAGNVLVNQGTGVSLYQAGASATGNRIVGAYGLATVMKVAANTWVISGTGVY